MFLNTIWHVHKCMPYPDNRQDHIYRCYSTFHVFSVYTWYMVCIYYVYTWIHTNFRISPDFESIIRSNRVPEELIHINASKNMKGTPQRQEEVSIYAKHLFFAVCTRYIPRIHLSWCLSWTLGGPLCLPASLGSLRPGHLAFLLCFGHRQAPRRSSTLPT